MTRRQSIELAIIAILAATVVILVLNVIEVDDYAPSSDLRFNDDVPSWVAPTVVHHCDACGECSHAFAASGCSLKITIRDLDGWYRLFWAGAETYVYDDAADVGRALRNPDALLVGGSWTILGEYTPVDKPGPHVCTPVIRRLELKYRIHRDPFPGPGDPVLDPSGTIAVPRQFLWFRYSFPPDHHVEDFWWELENPETFAEGEASPCTCGLPK